MRYPDLGKLDSTPEQDLGLNIAFKLAVKAQVTIAETPERFLALRVMDLLYDFADKHVASIKRQRVAAAVDDALGLSDEQKLAAVAAALDIDLTVVVPADVASDVADAATPNDLEAPK